MSYATSAGTATAGSDYTTTSGTLTIAAGETSGTINVPVTNDTDAESLETFTVTLSNPSNATLARSSLPCPLWTMKSSLITPVLWLMFMQKP